MGVLGSKPSFPSPRSIISAFDSIYPQSHDCKAVRNLEHCQLLPRTAARPLHERKIFPSATLDVLPPLRSESLRIISEGILTTIKRVEVYRNVVSLSYDNRILSCTPAAFGQNRVADSGASHVKKKTGYSRSAV